MKTLHQGATGAEVVELQRRLNTANVADAPLLRDDGSFGPRTEAAVVAYQVAHGLLADGIVGPATWESLGIAPPASEVFVDRERLPWMRIEVDRWGDGYDHLQLRADVGAALMRVRDEIHEVGALLTTSGGRRSLTAEVSSTRSATSLHYTGRAIDLFVHAGMTDPRSDAYVVTREPGGHWRVWAACERGRARILRGWVHKTQAEVEVSGFFVDLTAIFEKHGFERIRSRRNYPESYGAAEWWHHQYTRGLVEGVTTFGAELLRVYSLAELEGRAPWKYRDAVWGVDWH